MRLDECAREVLAIVKTHTICHLIIARSSGEEKCCALERDGRVVVVLKDRTFDGFDVWVNQCVLVQGLPPPTVRVETLAGTTCLVWGEGDELFASLQDVETVVASCIDTTHVNLAAKPGEEEESVRTSGDGGDMFACSSDDEEEEEEEGSSVCSSDDEEDDDEDEDDGEDEEAHMYSQVVFQKSTLEDAANNPGAHIVAAPEQTNKSGAFGIIACIRSRQYRPTLVVVGEGKKNVRGVARKLNNLGSSMPSSSSTSSSRLLPEFRFFDGRKDTWDARKPKANDTRLLADSKDGFIGKVKSGKCVLVVQAHRGVLKNVREFLWRNGVEELTVVLDEGDKILPCGFDLGSECQTQLRNLLSVKVRRNKRRNKRDKPTFTRNHIPLAPGAIVDNIIIVSATHFASMRWLEEVVGPDTMVWSHLADMQRVDDLGYATGKHLKLHIPMSDKYTATQLHGWHGREIKEMCQDFRDDYSDPNKRGALMMVAVGAAIYKNNGQETATNMQYAKSMLERCPKAVVVVYNSDGIIVSTAKLQDLAEPMGIKKYPGFLDASTFDPEDVQRLLALHTIPDKDARRAELEELASRRKRRDNKMTLGDFLQLVDTLEVVAPGVDGMRIPVACFGYELLLRSVSVRSNGRVNTHVIANLGKDKLTSDARQLLMRTSGRDCDAIREANGFTHVKVCMTESDFECSMAMTDMLFELLRPFEGGFRSIRGWQTFGQKHAYFARKYIPVIQSKRSHTVADRKRKTTFQQEGVNFDGQGPAKQRKLLEDIDRGMDVPGCDLLPIDAFTLTPAVPVVVTLPRANELQQCYEEEIAALSKPPTTNAKIFTSLCPRTADLCTVVLAEALLAAQRIEEADCVLGTVLCEVDGSRGLAKLKNSRAIMPVRPGHFRPSRTTKVVRSVHVDVREWKAYLVDGEVSIKGEEEEREEDEARSGDRIDPTSILLRDEVLIRILNGANVEDNLKCVFDRMMERLNQGGDEPDVQEISRRINRWGVGVFEVNDTSVPIDVGHGHDDWKVDISYVRGSQFMSVALNDRMPNMNVAHKIIQELGRTTPNTVPAFEKFAKNDPCWQFEKEFILAKQAAKGSKSPSLFHNITLKKALIKAGIIQET